MAVVVGVHGIAQQFGGGYQLARAWHDAVRDGLAAAGYRERADALADGELRVAFFGDLFRPEGVMGGAGAPLFRGDIRPDAERDLLAAWYDAAVLQDPALGPPPDALSARPITQVMLDRLLRSASFARVGQRAFIGNLRQVTEYLADRSVKDRVLERVHDLVDSGTRVLIGHSLGSVVAYEYLCQSAASSVQLLVTLGSPLGIPRLVFDRLTPAPADGAGAWPGTVISWLNVADTRDIVALRKELAGLFPPRSGGPGVCDRLVNNGDEPHSAERYLNARETGAALGDALS